MLILSHKIRCSTRKLFFKHLTPTRNLLQNKKKFQIKSILPVVVDVEVVVVDVVVVVEGVGGGGGEGQKG